MPHNTFKPSHLTTHKGDAKLAPFFVYSVWALMFSAALTFVLIFGSNVPYWDEWNMVRVLIGDQPITAQWLWSEHNGHRIPLPRLLLLALYKLSNADFRVGMFFNVLVLGALAFMMIWVAKVKRGETSYADAFFPLLLLHWGHYENLLWTWQVTQVMPVIIVSVLLLMIVLKGLHLTLRGAVLAGILLVILPLCGVPGLVYVPALALWLGSVGILHWLSSERSGKRKSLVIWCFILGALFIVFLHFVGYRESARQVSRLDPGESFKTALQFLTSGFGPAVEASWPYSGLVMLGILLLTSGTILGQVLRGHLDGRSRALGLLFFMLATACLALSVGLGRRGYGFTPRYFLIAAPALCCIYYSWLISGPSATSQIAQVVLFLFIAFMSPLNFREGLNYGKDYHNSMEAFKSDLLSGKPTSELLARHTPSLCPCPFGGGPTWGIVVDKSRLPAFRRESTTTCVAFHGWLGNLLWGLRRAGIGYFQSLQPERVAFSEVPLKGEPIPPPQVIKDILTNQGVNSDSNAVVIFEEPRLVYGLRITYRGDLPESGLVEPPYLQVFWTKNKRSNLTGAQRYIHYWYPGERQETVWIYDKIDELVINLDNKPDIFDLLDVVLLTPTDAAGPHHVRLPKRIY